MNALAVVVLLFGIWLVTDAVVGIWRTRNLFFAWQFLGISFIRLPLEALYYPEAEAIPMWSLLVGLLGTIVLLSGLIGTIISLLTNPHAINEYVAAKRNRGLAAWLFCLYQPEVEEIRSPHAHHR